MDILGISCYYHDAAAALIRDGELIAAAEEERFSRLKHDSGFPTHAIRFCLEAGGIDARDLDYFVFYEKPFIKFERILLSSLQTVPRSWRVFREAMVHWLLDKLWIKGLVRNELGVEAEKILFCEHHLSHAASTFYPSPFQEAAILTVDGVGEWTTTAAGYGRGTEVTLTKELRFPHSLGLLYSAFTAYLGFQVNEGEYKVMGMAPYGEPKYVDKVRKLIDLKEDGSFWLDMDYFSYHYSLDKTFNRRFEELFGPPRTPESYFFTPSSGYPSYFGAKPPDYEEKARQNQHYADVAASIQTVTEEALLNLARALHRETGLANLCIAGGVGLNSVANGRILRETPFERLFVQPAAGDGGGALGAALWAYHSLLGKPRTFRMEHACWGQEYPDSEVRAFLEETGIPYTYLEDEEALIDRVVEAIVDGQVVGWFQGRFEWGPRALGNRSILADPRRADMKEIVNTKIKFREPYRPFAPSILAERAEEYFDLPGAAEVLPARFMLLVAPVREDKHEVIPAVTHVDGSGRPQTVVADQSPRYHRLISRFEEATGVPALLNTSFNLRGEPIVTTPANAYNTFASSGMDLLVMNHHLVEAKPNQP
ncbi:carbamoyltransferase [Nitrospinae bacterium AH_259_B05_G02_I21]|nr:carbamoyltransferase [Nitrospinae bacterium AH_259_B05_G02_I21]MDA2932385.1 carbamoyltransferase [Nitrospinae bacterium AH-259-F20]